MAIIYSYPEIPDVQGGDLLLISDTGAPNKPTRSVDIDDLAAYIGTVVGVVQNLQSVLTVGNTYVSPDGHGTFTLNDIANNDGGITFVNTDEGWGYQISAEEGISIYGGNGTNLMSIQSSGLSIRDGAYIMNIGTNALTATRSVYFPDASGTIALTSDIPAPGPSGSGTANYTARWIDTDTLGIGALYDNGTNVGIGTTNPTNKLHVYNGITRLDSGSASSNALGVYSNFSNTAINLFAGSTGSGFVSVDSSGMNLGAPWNGGAKLSISNNGNVGIGTTSPVQKLSVITDDSLQAAASFRNTGTGSGLAVRTNDAATGSLLSLFSGSSYKFWFSRQGNLGIGTANPLQKLHVVGNARVTGAYYDSNNSPGTANQVLVSTATGTDWVDGSGSGIIGGPYLPLTGGTLSGNLTITKSSAMMKVSEAGGGDIRMVAGGSTGYIGTYNNTSMQIMQNGSNAIFIDTSKNIGIGTTSPGARLAIGDPGGSTTRSIQIEGNNSTSGMNGVIGYFSNGLYISNNYYYNSGQVHPVSTLGQTNIGCITGTTTGSNFIDFNVSDHTDSNNAPDIRMRIMDSGNVGIGTTSPAEKLDIAGNVRVGQNNGFYINNQNVGIKRDSNDLVLGGFGNVIIKSSNTTVVNQAERMRITSAGNVGIGTTSPANKLHVEGGNIQLSDNQHITWGYGGNNAIYGNNSSDFIKIFTNGSERLIVNSSGNVGIGTTSPSKKLDIAGDVKLTNSNSIYWRNAADNADIPLLNLSSNNTFNIGTTSSSVPVQMALHTAGSERIRISANGNVGIGTTSPDYLFEVEKTTSGSATLASFKNTENTGIRISRTGTSPGTSYLNVVNNGALYTSSDSHIAFQPGNSTSVFMQSTGNVGIGTTSPTKNLEIGTNGSAETEFRMHSDQAGKYINIQSAGNFTSVKTTGSQNFILDSSGSSGYITMVTNATERIRVNYNGNVGIGTTSPQKLLEVKSSTAYNSTLRLQTSAHNWDIQGGEAGYSSTAFALDYDGTTFFRAIGITDSRFSGGLSVGTINAAPPTGGLYVAGNVGIGTTSPGAKLSVNGNVKIEGTNSLLFGGSATIPNWEVKPSGSDLVINDTGSNVGSVLFNNDEGVALPRLTTTQINAISSPIQGLMAYNTTLNTICFYNGSSWQKVSHANM